MLKRSKKRKESRSPTLPRDTRRSIPMVVESPNGQANHLAVPPPPGHPGHTPRHSEPFSPSYDMSFSSPNTVQTAHNAHLHVPIIPPGPHHPPVHHHHHTGRPTTDADQIWEGFERTSQEQLPVWISDQSLGGQSFSQHGMDAFLLPTDYLPAAPQIW